MCPRNPLDGCKHLLNPVLPGLAKFFASNVVWSFELDSKEITVFLNNIGVLVIKVFFFSIHFEEWHFVYYWNVLLVDPLYYSRKKKQKATSKFFFIIIRLTVPFRLYPGSWSSTRYFMKLKSTVSVKLSCCYYRFVQ